VSGEDEGERTRLRKGIARGYTMVEDVVYVGLGLLLSGIVLALLVGSFFTFGKSILGGSFPSVIIGLLDQILLILLIVELLYTVQVSFRAHALVPEPFLVAGLISGIRRVLVLTAEYGEQREMTPEVANMMVLELAVLSGLILTLAIALVLLRRRGDRAVAERA
jgi:uncharacterized membrane protein (DUF373 family)